MRSSEELHDLIDRLAGNLKPVRPQMTPLRFALWFAGLSVLLALTLTTWLPVRPDIEMKLHQPGFLSQLLLNCILIFGSIWLCGFLSTPGLRISQAIALIVPAALLLLCAFDFLKLNESLEVPYEFARVGMKCAGSVALASAIFGFVILIALSRRAPDRPVKTGLLALLASTGTGMLLITIHCTLENGYHIAIFHHWLPVALGAATGSCVGWLTLRW